MKARESFTALLAHIGRQGRFLCIGLDSDHRHLPWLVELGDAWRAVYTFNAAIIDATKHIAAAYKPNLAFYMALGADGLHALQLTVDYIHANTQGIPVILDAKYADIGNTNNGYADYSFRRLGADAVTVHPYMGSHAMESFLSYGDKGIFVLCRTSNPGSDEFQMLAFNNRCLYEQVAITVAEKWNAKGNCGLVAGATYANELARIRTLAPSLPLLIPGVGAQGGDLEAAVHAAKDESGAGFLINASRSIIFASSKNDYAEAAAAEATSLHRQIRKCLTFEEIGR